MRFEGDLGIPSTSSEEVIGSLMRRIASVFDSTSCPFWRSWIFSRASAGDRDAIAGDRLVFDLLNFLIDNSLTSKITLRTLLQSNEQIV